MDRFFLLSSLTRNVHAYRESCQPAMTMSANVRYPGHRVTHHPPQKKRYPEGYLSWS